MAPCQKCWDEAFVTARLFGGHQADIYRGLVQARNDRGEVCTLDEQLHGYQAPSHEECLQVSTEVAVDTA